MQLTIILSNSTKADEIMTMKQHCKDPRLQNIYMEAFINGAHRLFVSNLFIQFTFAL